MTSSLLAAHAMTLFPNKGTSSGPEGWDLQMCMWGDTIQPIIDNFLKVPGKHGNGS